MSTTDTDHNLMSLFADLKVTLGDLRDTAKRREQREVQQLAKLAAQPSYNEIHGSVTLDANGFGVIRFDLQGPNQGYTWNVRKLVVGNLTPATAVPGRADVFATASDLTNTQTLASLGLLGWQDSITGLPAVETYGEGEMVCRAMEELWVIISAGTPASNVTAIARLQNVQESAKDQGWAL